MMQLIPFTTAHYDLLIQWIPDQEFNYLWGGPAYQWPLDAEQISQHVAHKSVYPYLFIDEGEPAGYIELIQTSKRKFRICRVLIARPESRGKGRGAILMRMVMDKATDEFKAKEFELSVFEHNKNAVSCYRRLGFTTFSMEPINHDQSGFESWIRHKMKLEA